MRCSLNNVDEEGDERCYNKRAVDEHKGAKIVYLLLQSCERETTSTQKLDVLKLNPFEVLLYVDVLFISSAPNVR